MNIRAHITALCATLALVVGLIIGVASPSVASTASWPYPENTTPAIPDPPWQCGIWRVGPNTEACKRWNHHADILIDVKAKGETSRRAVSAVLASSRLYDLAVAAGNVAASRTSHCGQLIRWQTGHMVNEIASKENLADQMQRVLRLVAKRGKFSWPAARTVYNTAVSISSQYFVMQQSRAILLAARTANCIS